MKINIHRELLRLRQNNRCYWCKCEMTPTLPNRRRDDPPFPDTMCTLDHIFSRGDPRRWNPNIRRGRRRVAACFGCNQQRGAEEQAKKSLKPKHHGTATSFQRF